MAGSLGITALVAALGRAFGWHSLLVSRFGDWAGDATVAFLALLLSLVLLYPLWLGMRAYAITLFHGEVGAEEGLFGFYTHTRLRRFAAMGALRLLGGVAILALAMAAVLLTGRGLSAHFLALGNLGRAAVCSLLTPILALLLPLLWWWNEQADALALRFYLRDETLTVREARRASRFAMRHKGGLRMLLLLKKMPLAAIGLLFFGIGLALFSIPDLVWSLALFESRPT